MQDNERERTKTKRDKSEARKRSNANLKIFTSETAAARGRAGGKRSGEIKREKKTLRETLELLLSMPSKKRKGMTVQESGCVELAIEFERGNLRAWELLRDTIGQKPTEADNKHIQGNVYVSWQGADGDSIKAVSSARGTGVQIESKSVDNTVSVSASEAVSADSNAEV